MVFLVEYRGFFVEALEQKPGRWRAKVSRTDGKPVKVVGRRKLEQFVTGFDAKTASAAILMAIAVIDGGMFTRNRAGTEKFWRRRAQSSIDLTTGARSGLSVRHASHVRASRTPCSRRSRSK
jgi:hypothetical protein